MSCCGLLPLAREHFRRRRDRKAKAKNSPFSSTSTSDVVNNHHHNMEAPEPERTTNNVGVETESPLQVDEDRSERRTRTSPVEYVATGYCGLCRIQLPHNPLPVVETRNEEWQQWEGDLRAVLCVDYENEEDCVITDTFRVTPEDVDATKIARIRHAKYDNVSLELKIALLDNTLAYVFHSWCYDVLRWKNDMKDPDVVYRLTKSLSHESSPWETIGLGDGWLDAPSRIKTLIGDMNDDQSSKLQPVFLSRLPAELRAPIWGFVGTRSAYSSFLLVTQETARLVPKLEKTLNRTIQLGKGSWISTELIDIFGTSFLRKISNDIGMSKVGLTIQEDLTAIKIIASLAGICAMKLVGTTWESDWIGRIPVAGQIWYGTLNDPGPTAEAIFTGLTCLDLKHKPPPQLMWDRPDFPPHLMERDTLTDEAIWLRHTSLSRFEFIRFLPLFCGKEAAKGLTMFCSPTGVIGMAAHFKHTTFFSGYRDGLPVYIPFVQGEGIRNMWYRLGEGSLDSPGMVIQTTKNRNYHIGTYMSPESLAPHCRWAPMNNYLYTSITGIFYQNPRREIYCCSVLGKNRSDYSFTQTPSMAHGVMPELSARHPARSGNGLLLSTARLANVQKLRCCRVGERCVGMLVGYEDGTEAALGQWHVPDTMPLVIYEDIYDNRTEKGRGEPISLRFHHSDAQTSHTASVRRIEILHGDAPLIANATDVYWNTGIQWWFSREWDSVSTWNEAQYAIPMEHHVFLQ